jgi:AcrR family transcriptional regulator
MAITRTQKSERRRSLIQAATEAMSELGVAESRLSDIAARANISAGQVLYYFESKSDLLLQALYAIERDLRDDVLTVTRKMISTVERWDYLLATAAPSGPGDFRLLLWLEAWALAPRDEAVARRLQQLEDQWLELLLGLLEPGREAGELECDDLEGFVMRFSALMDGLTIQVVAGSSSIDRARMLEICWQVTRADLHLAPK